MDAKVTFPPAQMALTWTTNRQFKQDQSINLYLQVLGRFMTFEPFYWSSTWKMHRDFWTLITFTIEPRLSIEARMPIVRKAMHSFMMLWKSVIALALSQTTPANFAMLPITDHTRNAARCVSLWGFIAVYMPSDGHSWWTSWLYRY
jgi:hypothetical protein